MKKADDMTVVGPLVALEDGAIVLNVTAEEGKPPVRTRIPLADVVEVTIDPEVDVPSVAAAAAAQPGPAPDAPPAAASAEAEPSRPESPPQPDAPEDSPAPADTAPDTTAPDTTAPDTTAPAPAGDARPANAPAADETGFERIFNGKTLAGWEGDPAFWSVRDGAITGVAGQEHLRDHSTFLHWGGGELGDFELRARYRIVGGHPGSSGIVYRGKVTDPANFQVGGYQLDLGEDPKVTGSLFDEGAVAGKRDTMAEQGQKVVFRIDGGKDVQQGGLPDAGAARAAIKPGDWNDVSITVTGNRLIHRINGHVLADVTDDAPQQLLSGVLALQLDFRAPVSVQFKDLRVRRGPGDGTPATPARLDWIVRLKGGDQLSGELLGWGDRRLRLRTAHGEVDLPVTQLREVWHASPDDVNKARAARGSGAAATEDVAFARRGGDANADQIVPVGGLVLGVDGESLRFRFRDQERKIALDKLVGVTLAAPEEAAGAIDGPLRQSLVLAGGSGDVVTGNWTALDPATGAITLDTPWGGEPLQVPVKAVERIRTKNGRLLYLSDLPPAQVEQVPYFDRLLPYRIDQSLTGGPIKLTGSDHTRGISVHARTVLRYDVGGRFERFRAKVGFQQPEGKAGRAVVRVLGDNDKVLHEIPDARGDQPPADLDLDVTGVTRLTLEVDFGADQDVADRVVWADARLIRAASAPSSVPESQ